MSWSRSSKWATMVCLLAIMAAGATYPVEPWPDNSDVAALNGTTDDATGLVYVPLDTDEQSSPPLITQLDRMFQRERQILGEVNKLRVVKASTTQIGIFPGHYRLGGTSYYYPGEDDKSVSTSADTYYVYLTSDSDEGGSGTATIVTDAAGWPADVGTYIPLAEIVVADSVISTITDVRSRVLFAADLDTDLVAIAALATTDSNIIVGNGTTWVAESGATARTSLGLSIGTNVQAYDADLGALAALASTGLVARTGSATYSERTVTAGNGVTITNGNGVSGNPTIAAIGGFFKPSATTCAGGVLAIPITHGIVVKTTGGAESLTLANGTQGQLLTVILGTDGGKGTLAPTTKTGFATIEFDDAGDHATLYYVDDTYGWTIVGLSGVAGPPAITV